MKRKQLLELIKLAIAEDDHKTAMRIYTENRISRNAFNKAFEDGELLKAKLNGRKLSEVTFG